MYLLFWVSVSEPVKSFINRSGRSLIKVPCKYVKHDGTCIDAILKYRHKYLTDIKTAYVLLKVI